MVGAPDEQYGELVYAFIRPKEGAVVTKEGLRNWCRGKIATIKIPQEIELTDHFPISATGKISKGQLRSLARSIWKEGDAADGAGNGRGRTAADGNGRTAAGGNGNGRTAAGGNGIRRTAAVR